jgi:hypothetical protein
MFFLAGQALHILKRAGMAVRSKSNPIRSRREFLRLFWDVLLIRTVLCASAFWVALQNPQSLARLTHTWELPPDLSLRWSAGTALMFGYFADSIFDWIASRIPIFRREMPAVADMEQSNGRIPP